MPASSLVRLFFGLRTKHARQRAERRPCRISLERLEDRRLLSMTNAGGISLATSVSKGLYAGAIDTTTGYGYFGSGVVTKVNLNGAVPVEVNDGLATTIPAGSGNFTIGLIDTSDPNPANHFLYFTGSSGKIIKMAPGDATHGPTYVSTLVPTSATGGISCGVIDTSNADPTKHYLYFGVAGTPNKILRVRLSDFSDQGAETASVSGFLRTAVIDTQRGYAYFTPTGTTDPSITKVNLATFTNGGTVTSTLDLSSTTTGDGIAKVGFDMPSLDEAVLIDVAHNYAYLGTYTFDTSPGHTKINTFPYNQSTVIRIALGSGDAFPAHPVQTYDLPVGQRDLSASVFDPVHGDAYFGTDNTYPAHIYKVHVGDGTTAMTETGVLDLNTGTVTPLPQDGTTVPGADATQYGEVFLRSAVIDTAHDTAYWGTDTRPDQVIKVNFNNTTAQVIVTGNTADVYGSANPNTFVFTPGASFIVTVNGVQTALDPAVVSIINFHGNGAADTVIMNGSSGVDSAMIRVGSADLVGTGYAVHALNIDNIYVVSGGGADNAVMYDTTGKDTFIGTPTYASLSGTGYQNVVYGYSSVSAIASSDTDVAQLYGSSGTDTFVATSVYGRLFGTGFNNVVYHFSALSAIAGAGGADAAVEYTSSGNNTFVGTATYAQTFGTGFNNVAYGFPSVFAYVTPGGTNNAIFYAAASNTFIGTPTYGRLYGTGIDETAYSFNSATAIGSAGGRQLAYLYGAGNGDTFVGTSAYGQLSNTAFNNSAYGFSSVYAVAIPGTNAVAYLYDSPGNDGFYGRTNYGYLYSSLFLNNVSNFAQVFAISNSGGHDTIDTNSLDYVFHKIGAWS